MSNAELQSEQPKEREGSEIKPESMPDKKELKPKEIIKCANAAIESIGGKEQKELNEENWKEAVEKSILNGVHELPELLADKLKTVDGPLFNAKAEEILSQISQEQDFAKIAQLQIELIYQYIGIISRVQNGGDKGFTPLVAREVNGLDCSLSAWALKEKLQASGVENISFEFGYLPGHAVGVVTLADKSKMYVDAQNGIVEKVDLEEVSEEDTKTAYPIFKITTRERMVGHLPSEEATTRTNKTGSDYTPGWIGIQEDGILHTLGNMHMFINPSSGIFNTEAAEKFREGLNINVPVSELSGEQWTSYWEKFDKLVEKLKGGKTIYDTKWGKLEEQRHEDYRNAQRKAIDEEEIGKIKKSL